MNKQDALEAARRVAARARTKAETTADDLWPKLEEALPVVSAAGEGAVEGWRTGRTPRERALRAALYATIRAGEEVARRNDKGRGPAGVPVN